MASKDFKTYLAHKIFVAIYIYIYYYTYIYTTVIFPPFLTIYLYYCPLACYTLRPQFPFLPLVPGSPNCYNHQAIAVSRHHGDRIDGYLKPPEHHGTMAPRGCHPSPHTSPFTGHVTPVRRLVISGRAFPCHRWYVM